MCFVNLFRPPRGSLPGVPAGRERYAPRRLPRSVVCSPPGESAPPCQFAPRAAFLTAPSARGPLRRACPFSVSLPRSLSPMPDHRGASPYFSFSCLLLFSCRPENKNLLPPRRQEGITAKHTGRGAKTKAPCRPGGRGISEKFLGGGRAVPDATPAYRMRTRITPFVPARAQAVSSLGQEAMSMSV